MFENPYTFDTESETEEIIVEAIPISPKAAKNMLLNGTAVEVKAKSKAKEVKAKALRPKTKSMKQKGAAKREIVSVRTVTENGEEFDEYKITRPKDKSAFYAFKAQMKSIKGKLSNFADCEVFYNGLTYPSVEHAFQAQKFIPEQRALFRKFGPFGSWEDFVPFAGARGVTVKNTSVHGFVGLIAKMISNPKMAEKLGLNFVKLDMDRNALRQHNFRLILELHKIKFQIPFFKELLFSTGNTYLYEPTRGKVTNAKLWDAGMEWKDNKCVKMHGFNLNGKAMMVARSILRV